MQNNLNLIQNEDVLAEQTSLNVLLICNYEPYNAATVSDHINALILESEHNVTGYSGTVSHFGDLPNDIDLSLFDAVILHYSVFLAIDNYISPKTRKKLKEFQGVKAIFLQDEYRFVDDSVHYISDLGFDIIFTCIPQDGIEAVYPTEKLPHTQKINVLTGYVPKMLLSYPVKKLSQRKYDVSYRGRVYPFWHGTLGEEKWKIAEEFTKRTEGKELSTNISTLEKDRKYGAEWVELIRDSKAVLGVESGASVFDFQGDISHRIDTTIALNDREAIDEEALKKELFSGQEDIIPIRQISPRIFEAIALRTMCILFEGEYSGVLEPWRHYVPLKKDFSNLDEVLAVLKDNKKCSEIITNAYVEVACNRKFAYQTLVGKVDDALKLASQEKRRVKPLNPQETADKIAEIQKKHSLITMRNPHCLSPTTLLVTTPLLKRILKKILPVSVVNKLKTLMR